ncbi:MAG: 3-dehydroquinate synthase [Alphaproteobacteria bacterium]
MVERIPITLPNHAYDIVIGERLLVQPEEFLLPVLQSSRVIIVSDNQVARFWLHRLTGALENAGIQYHTIIIPAGETSKRLEHFTDMLEMILEHKPDRNTAILALGGGVVGDMAGFAASCALRGLPYIQLPTSLLAQVDSSVGGKTAVNSQHGKNLIGSFYQPQLVLIDTGTLSTLPERELKAGYAEVLKYALIADRPFFEWLEANGKDVLAKKPDAIRHVIKTSCMAKAAIVMQDEKEKGPRALLNFGHTFGHALELECGMNDTLLHGEAVALGMLLAMETSVAMGMCPPEDYARVLKHYANLQLTSSLHEIAHTFDAKRLMEHFGHDKKAINGMPTFILSRGIGQAYIEPAAELAIIAQILEKACPRV